MAEAPETLAKAITKFRTLNRQLRRNGFRAYSEALSEALGELEMVRQLLPNAPPGEEQPCPKCLGCGQVADTDDQTPWSLWLKPPLESSQAAVSGLVKPIPCPRCVAPAEEGR